MDETHDIRTIVQGAAARAVSVRHRIEGTVFRVVRVK